jgi:signal transduction histidine kinase
MLDNISGFASRERSRTDRQILSGASGIGLAVLVGVAYFLAGQLSQGLILDDGVAVFWPAAGLSAGALIALGPRGRWPVAAGAAAATIAVHFIMADPLWSGVALGLCNAGEALIVAGLLTYYFSAHYNLGRLSHVLGLLAATVAATTVSGIGAAVTYRLAQGPSAALLATWYHWFASDAVGIVAGAPLVIGLIGAARERPPRREFVEGTAVLVVLAAMTGVIISLPPEPWDTVVPIALLFPMLIWLAARCRPVFATAGAFIVSITIVWTSIGGIGYFGNPEHIIEGQAGILVVAIGALVLAALFAERRESEARLAHSVVLLKRERENKLMNIQAATSSIAHEVRQPLTGITARASAARRWLERVPPDVNRAKQLISDIEVAGFRANEVLANVRALFQEADRERQAVDVNDLARETLQILHEELNSRGVQTNVELASELPAVMGHRGQLEEVIVNLVHNAIDSMALIKLGHRTLKVRTKPEGAQAITIQVEDSGHGIEPERLDEIFEPFVTTKPHGTGLGLAICRAIIERHGGRLSASSDGKNGALFQIVLPVRAV